MFAQRPHLFAVDCDVPGLDVRAGDVVIVDPCAPALAASEGALRLAPNNVDLLVTAALAEEALGRWDPAFQHLAKAATLDPRSANAARRAGFALLWLRRYVPTA